MYAIFQDNTVIGFKHAATFTVCELAEGAYIAPAGYPVGEYSPLMVKATIEQARALKAELEKDVDC